MYKCDNCGNTADGGWQVREDIFICPSCAPEFQDAEDLVDDIVIFRQEQAAAEEEYDNPDRLCTTQGIIVEETGEFIKAKITWYAG